MDKIREISIKDLISIWVDMSRANNQHTLDGSTKWNSSVRNNILIENIEFVLSDKLQITLLECKIILDSKKKVIDAKEKKLLQKNTRKNKVAKRKKQKYLARLADGMGIVQTQVFHAHHGVCKLDKMEETGTETETETEDNNNNK